MDGVAPGAFAFQVAEAGAADVAVEGEEEVGVL